MTESLHIILLGTCDTKLDELLYLRQQIEAQGQSQGHDCTVTLIDIGRTPVSHPDITITSDCLLQGDSPNAADDVSHLPRNELLSHMSDCASTSIQKLRRSRQIHGIISAGGTGNTSAASAVMRSLPLGLPKLIVSTVAAGDTTPIIEDSDIILIPSIVDIAGLNSLLRTVLDSAAAAIAGMARAYRARAEAEARDNEEEDAEEVKKVRLGITMFGVTTPAVDTIRRHLNDNYPGRVEPYVFHATGTGGRALERLVREGRLDAMLDLTTTEICDYVAGGVMSAGPARLDAACEAGVPMVLCPGACDMVNFGPRESVPERYKDRRLYRHNDVVTLMRTNKEECKEVADFIVRKLKQHKQPEKVSVWIPEAGVSAISTRGGVFEDKEADEVLLGGLRRGLEGSGIKVVTDGKAINDEGFAVAVADEVLRLWGSKGQPG